MSLIPVDAPATGALPVPPARLTCDLPLQSGEGIAQVWDRLAAQASQWLDQHGCAPRDAVVLLPFAQHLAPARRAWLKLSRWQPRIETTRSLASALGPSPLAEALQISFDAAIDALAARQLLVGQSWAQALQTQDPRAFDAAVDRLVEAAHALVREAWLRAPSTRSDFWTQAREAATAQAGVGQLERALLSVAVAWAAADTRVPATDALFHLRPSAWIHLQCGGPDPLADALLADAETAGIPCLRLNADIDLDHAFDDSPPPGHVEEAVCEDFESLAQCSAAAVLAHLAAGRAPVALLAQDRVLIRRVRALLERQQLGIADETGWTLATTAPAAQLMALLRTTRRDATVDDWLAWLKTPLAASLRERAGSLALATLESRCRSRGWSKPESVRDDQLAPGSARLWSMAREAVALLQVRTAQSLEDWLAALTQTLQQLGADEQLDRQSAGGPQLLDALWLRRSPWPGSAHEAVLKSSQLTAAEFMAWVSDTLEAAQYVPPLEGGLQVMITPMARAMLRPFGAVVLPGADAATLGPVPAGPALISDPLARELGLPTVESKRQAITWQFTQLLRAPQLTLLRRDHVGSEPLPASPLLERLHLALRSAGRAPVARWQDPRLEASVAPSPTTRAQAIAPDHLPQALSASAVESLRQCPYQFFARVVLGLREASELDVQADKRDYGTWLHAVLHQFHDERRRGEAPELDDAQRLERASQDQMRWLGLSPAEFLPYAASFARFAPAYLSWLQEREAHGQTFMDGEVDRAVTPWAATAPALAGLTLRGRIDRIDTSPQALELLDYKTGSVKGLKDKVTVPLEDTQLAVYAALMQGQGDAPTPMRAHYVALDDSSGICTIEHPDVAHTAAVMLDGLRGDLLAMQGGAPLPALGEGSACEYCEMRGLCRRDDWDGAAP